MSIQKNIVALHKELEKEDVEPGGGGQELVGKLPVSEEIDQCRELRRVFRTNVGSLADEVLGVLHTAHLVIDGLTAEARIDDDRATSAILLTMSSTAQAY